MRRAQVFRRPSWGWTVRLIQMPGVVSYDPLDGGEFHFDEWTDALAWAVRMVGA